MYATLAAWTERLLLMHSQYEEKEKETMINDYRALLLDDEMPRVKEVKLYMGA